MPTEIDEATAERYQIIKDTRICPVDGQDMRKLTLGEWRDERKARKEQVEKLEPDEDPEAVAYVCTHTECNYGICIGEKEESNG